MAKRLREISGFSLLEGMIATAILSVGVLAIGSMQGITLRRNVDATELSQAVNLASEMLERIQYNRQNVLAYNGIDTTLACAQNPVTQPMAWGDCTQWRELLGALNNPNNSRSPQKSGVSQASWLKGVTGTVAVTPTVTIPPLNQSVVTVTVTWSGLSMGNAVGTPRRVVLNATIAPE